MLGMRPRVVVVLLVAVAAGLAACSDGDDGAGTTTSEAPASTTTSEAPPSTTATTTAPRPSQCTADELAMREVVDGWVAEAGLAPGEWVDPATETPFDDATHRPDAFAESVGMPCSLRAVQITEAGDTRLVLASYVLPRYGFVLQATDGPGEPFAPVVTFDLLSEVARGEWLAEQATWAATLESGHSILIGVEDFAPGAVAKSWQSAFSPPPMAEVTLVSEQLGIDAFVDIDATNVGVAQPPELGSQVGTVMGVSDAGQILVAYVGPPDEVRIEDPWLGGESSSEEVGAVTVLVTLPADGQLDVAEARFACGAVDLRLASTFGTAAELVAVAEDLIAVLDCETGVQVQPDLPA